MRTRKGAKSSIRYLGFKYTFSLTCGGENDTDTEVHRSCYALKSL